jgi:hypothetical protein
MLSFDFEAAVQLKQWETLESLIEAAKPVADEHLYSVYADAVLSSEASVEQKTRVFEVFEFLFCYRRPFVSLLFTSFFFLRFIFFNISLSNCTYRTRKQQIVDAFQTSNNQLDSCSYHKKLPRYFRCLFELSMASTNNPSALSPANTAMAEMVLDRVYMFARNTHLSTNNPPAYPADELEWLATTVFNHALDFYVASNDEDSQRWGRRAIELAGLMHGDKGNKLVSVLREKFQSLWGAE